MITCTAHLNPCLRSNFSFPSLMPAAFEDNNNLVIPPLNKIGSWLHLGKRLVWLCLLKILPYIPVNIGRGTAKCNTSFNHCVILLITSYENASENVDHVYHINSHISCKRTEENSLTRSVAYLWLFLYLAAALQPCTLGSV